MDKKYKNPPLAEAVFELFYESDQWDSTIPGLFYSKVSDKYPKKNNPITGFGINLGNQKININQGIQDITQFLNTEGNRILQLSNSMFTVNRLPSYIGWEEFESEINYAVKCLIDTISIKKVQRIGLKFVNKIDIQERTYTNLKKYFKSYPVFQAEADEIIGLHCIFEFPFKSQGQIQSITLASILPEAGFKNPILYQLYAAKINDVLLDEIKTWINDAHSQLKKLFEDNLTEDCKKTFDNE